MFNNFPCFAFSQFSFYCRMWLDKKIRQFIEQEETNISAQILIFFPNEKRVSWNANGKTKAQENGGKIITIWFFQLLVSQAVNVMRPPHYFQLVEEEERLQDLMSIQALELSNNKEFQVKYFRQ